jgi:hypothetical protein
MDFGGLPIGHLKLKVGALIMLLRNLSVIYSILMRLQGRLWEGRRERVVLGREEASFPQLSTSRHP